MECGWNPFCRQEEISSRPCSVSLKNPVLEQINTSSVRLKPLQIEAPPSVSQGARLSLLTSSKSRAACCGTLLCPGHSSPQPCGCSPLSFHGWATTAQIRPPPAPNQLRRAVKSRMLFQPLLVKRSLCDLTFYCHTRNPVEEGSW